MKSNIFVILIFSSLQFFSTNATSLFPTSTNNQYEAYLKFIDSSNNNNNYRLLLICLNNNHYNNSIINLNLFDTIYNSLNVYAIKANGGIESFHNNNNLSKMQYFNGTMKNLNSNLIINVSATGIIDIDKQMISLIIYTTDKFYITPSVHLNSHFIVEQTFKNFRKKFFQFNYHHHHRDKRNNVLYCGVKLRITYDLYKLFNYNIILITQHSQFVIRFVNRIFLETEWTKKGLKNLSFNSNDFEKFKIITCEIFIETERPYNYSLILQENWNFTKIYNYIEFLSDKDYCLSHVFTSITLKNINGVGWKSGLFDEINGAISSFGRCQNPWEHYCILSVVHEFGHNFGSSHDIDDEECIPKEGGSYIMSYPFISEIGPNNFKFSPCSIRAIFHHVNFTKQYFLQVTHEDSCGIPKCGNLIVEGDEICDEGKNGGKCCNNKCQLRPKAECSQSQQNALCCNSECKIRKKGEECLPKDLKYCFEHSKCDGVNITCPNRRKLPDNTLCEENYGFCSNGVCKMCEKHIEKCYFCCKNNSSILCKPNQMLPAGTKCKLDNSDIPAQCDIEGVCRDLNDFIDPTRIPSIDINIENKLNKINILEYIFYMFIITVIILTSLYLLIYQISKKYQLDEYDSNEVLLKSHEKRDSSNAMEMNEITKLNN